jgi:hypothetical protein
MKNQRKINQKVITIDLTLILPQEAAFILRFLFSGKIHEGSCLINLNF